MSLQSKIVEYFNLRTGITTPVLREIKIDELGIE